MAVEVDLGLLVTDGNRVVVVNANRLESHHVVAQGLLELRSHEVVSWSRPVENRKVYLEPEKVEKERDDNEANGTSSKVLSKLWKTQSTLATVDIGQIPQVNEDGNTDRKEGEGTNVFCRDNAAQGHARQEQPLPPLSAEGIMAKLVEANVGEHGKGHEEDQGRIEEDQASLADVGVIEEHETGCSNAGWQRVSRLPHDHEDGRDGKSTHGRGHGAVCDVRDLVRDVRVTNVFEEEAAIVSDKPAGEGKEELSEGRVHIEEVGSLEVVGSELGVCQPRWYSGIWMIWLAAVCRFTYLSKVHLIEHNLVRVVDAPEAGYESQHGNDSNRNPIVPFRTLVRLELALRLLDGTVDIIWDGVRVGCGRSFLVLGATLPHASW